MSFVLQHASRSTNVIPVYDIQNNGLWKQVLEVSVSYTYTHIHIMADKKKSYQTLVFPFTV